MFRRKVRTVAAIVAPSTEQERIAYVREMSRRQNSALIADLLDRETRYRRV